MRYLVGLLVLSVLACPWTVDAYEIDERVVNAFGPLPRQGSLEDVLECSGANQVYWIYLKKNDPVHPDLDEAQGKASWYSAVALWVFAVKNAAINDAIASAENLPLQEAIKLAKQCRKAPRDWQNRPGWRNAERN